MCFNCCLCVNYQWLLSFSDLAKKLSNWKPFDLSPSLFCLLSSLIKLNYYDKTKVPIWSIRVLTFFSTTRPVRNKTSGQSSVKIMFRNFTVYVYILVKLTHIHIFCSHKYKSLELNVDSKTTYISSKKRNQSDSLSLISLAFKKHGPFILWNGCSHSNWVLRRILTVTTVRNTGEPRDINMLK